MKEDTVNKKLLLAHAPTAMLDTLPAGHASPWPLSDYQRIVDVAALLRASQETGATPAILDAARRALAIWCDRLVVRQRQRYSASREALIVEVRAQYDALVGRALAQARDPG